MKRYTDGKKRVRAIRQKRTGRKENGGKTEVSSKQTYEERIIEMKAHEGSERARRREMFGKEKTSKKKKKRVEGGEERSEVRKGRRRKGGREGGGRAAGGT